MATLTIQSNDVNDIFLPDGVNLSLLSGVAACEQNILQKTQLRLGEDIFNTGNGVDYFGTMLTSTPNLDAARASLIAQIESCPDVLGVSSLTLSIADGVISYTAQVQTIYGPLPVSS